MEENKKSGFVKIVVAVVIAAGVLFGYMRYSGAKKMQAAQQAQQAMAAREIIVMTEPVVKTDASAQASEYVGHVEAIQSVQVKPQIAGIIDSVCFKEGSLVKAGTVLFKIESSQFEAAVASCKAELERAEANLVRADKYNARVKAAEAKAVSAADRDKAECDVLSARASVSQAKAALRTAEINLGYCTVKAPITGKIGRAEQTKGNYVSPAGAALASMVQVDPIRVSYTMPDKDYLNLLDKFKQNGAVFKTRLLLSNGEEIASNGERDFENNTFDKNTGTILMRVRYKNNGGKLIPGEMVRVVTNPAESRIVLTVPQVAVASDTKGSYVFRVGSDSKVEQVYITLGQELGQSFEVQNGLSEGDNIVTAGIQNLRSGMAVKIAERTAPTAQEKQEAEAQEQAAEAK